MGRHHNRFRANLLIFFIAIAFLPYITYLLGDYNRYSLKADNNSSIRINNGTFEFVPYGKDTNMGGINLPILPAAELRLGNTHRQQNIERDINDINNNNAGAYIKNTSTKEIAGANGIRSQNKIVTMIENSKQKEAESRPQKSQVKGMAGEKITSPIGEPQKNINLDGTLNKYVLDIIKAYKIGKYPYLLNNDYQNYNGVTENLYYNGKLLLKANPNGNKASHCTGITFEVFFKAMQNRNKDLGIDINNFNGMNNDELYDFVLIWYRAKGPEGMGNVALAMEKYGVGKGIHNMEELRAGDFINFSRENGTGHSGVFINWIREGNKIIGFRYWSSQGSTEGINYKEEYFNIKRKNGNIYGNVMIDSLYMGRISPVSEYKNFK